jgi:hypothetical protein
MSSTKKRWLGVLRVAVYALVVAALGGVLLARKVVAKAAEQTWAIANELGEWSALIGPSTEVTVNGQQLFLGSKTLALPVTEVLDRFEALCRADDADPLAGLSAQVATPATPARPAWLDRLLVLRHSVDEQGVAVCLAGAGRGGLSGLRDRLQRFAQTRDLGTIGALRYVRARTTSRGTQVIAVWNRGPLQLDAWLPQNGDAPGADFPDGARPSDAVRVLSAAVPDSAQRVNLYRSAQEPQRALDDYARVLSARGFAPLSTRGTGHGEHGLGRAYVKDRRVVLVRSGKDKDQAGSSVLSVFELGADTPLLAGAP